MWSKAIIILGLSCLCSAQYNFQSHFEHLSSVRHPLADGGQGWDAARAYVFHTLLATKMEMYLQNFTSTIVDKQDQIDFHGTNIVAVARGSKSGHVLVVGADLDTTVDSNPAQSEPLKDNGSGISILLELARVFMERLAGKTLEHTVVFVAFDLNTRERVTQSPSKPGAEFFVTNWLPNFLNNSATNFDGAVILDSVSTYSINNNTQHLPAGFDQTFPEANIRIIAEGLKGDYLAIMTRGDDRNQDLWKSFSGSFLRDRKRRQFRLQELKLVDGSYISSSIVDLVHKPSSVHFWANNYPAALLTDTKYYRQDPCVPSQSCGIQNFPNPDRINFMEVTANSLLTLLWQRQVDHGSSTLPHQSTTYRPPHSGSSRSFEGILGIFITAFFWKYFA